MVVAEQLSALACRPGLITSHTPSHTFPPGDPAHQPHLLARQRDTFLADDNARVCANCSIVIELEAFCAPGRITIVWGRAAPVYSYNPSSNDANGPHLALTSITRRAICGGDCGSNPLSLTTIVLFRPASSPNQPCHTFRNRLSLLTTAFSIFNNGTPNCHSITTFPPTAQACSAGRALRLGAMVRHLLFPAPA